MRGGRGQGLGPVDVVEDVEVSGEGNVGVDHRCESAAEVGFEVGGTDREVIGVVVDVGA